MTHLVGSNLELNLKGTSRKSYKII